MMGATKVKIFRYLAFSVLLAMSVSAANGQDYNEGVLAYLSNDFKTAFKELMPLAENDEVRAQFLIGRMYRGGNGVIQSDFEAVKWYQLSADQGFSSAQCDLGFMYENGKGVIQSYDEAAKWYRLAADQGYAPCQTYLGLLYALGNGVVQNLAEAAKLFSLSAYQGDPAGQFGLASSLENGMGVVQDSVRAHMWYNIASANGYKYAADSRDRVALTMTQQAVEKAQSMAQECISSSYRNCGD